MGIIKLDFGGQVAKVKERQQKKWWRQLLDRSVRDWANRVIGAKRAS